MYSSEIRSIDLGLADLAGEVPPQAWEIVRSVRRNLKSLAEQLENLEKTLLVSEEKEELHGYEN